MKKDLIDIECYINYFCLGIKDFITKEITFYEISEERNDLEQIYAYMKSFKGFLISFNGIHYDEVVLSHLVLNYTKYKHLNAIDICVDLKYLSDKVINNDFDSQDVKDAKYMKRSYISLDLFMYWSKMLRLSKKMSLKALGIQMGYSVVQELPFKPDTVLKIEDLPTLRYYNYTHDLGILEMLTTTMEEDIKLRANIVTDYGLNCWSWDAPKIASEALLVDYCKASGRNPKYVRQERFEKGSMYLNDILKGFDPEFKLPLFQKLFTEVLNSQGSYSKELLVNINNTSIRLTYGIGGLHSINENETYETSDDIQVVTSDVALT